jgi:glycosyltransferase involved in cell wall biosynthesis
VHGETGFNVPVRDSKALADALRQLLDNPAQREQMGAAARLRYEREFAAGLMTQRTRAIYGSLLADD